MRLAAARWAEHQQIGALVEPAVAGTECHHLGLADHRHRLEVEAVESFAGRQTRHLEMALDTPTRAFGHLVLGQRRQEARSRPALLVGAGGKVRPDDLHGRQPQSVSARLEAAGINRIGALHATSPGCPLASSS